MNNVNVIVCNELTALTCTLPTSFRPYVRQSLVQLVFSISPRQDSAVAARPCQPLVVEGVVRGTLVAYASDPGFVAQS